MTPEESAENGAHCAKMIQAPIQSSMALRGVSKVHWWGGFMAALAAQCYNEVGSEAHAIIMGVTAQALKATTTRTMQ